MIRNTMTKEILSKSRLTNFWLKSLIVIFVLLTTLGIYWKKKRILLKIPKYQWNVLTLNQTVALIFLVYTNNLLCDYLLIFFPPSELLFILEELRVILVENLIIRFLLPFFLILNTKRRLPALWTETSWKRREFFMTKINFQSHYPQTEVSFDQEERRQKDLFKYNDRTTTTTLANTAMGSNIPEVSDWTRKYLIFLFPYDKYIISKWLTRNKKYKDSFYLLFYFFFFILLPEVYSLMSLMI